MVSGAGPTSHRVRGEAGTVRTVGMGRLSSRHRAEAVAVADETDLSKSRKQTCKAFWSLVEALRFIKTRQGIECNGYSKGLMFHESKKVKSELTSMTTLTEAVDTQSTHDIPSIGSNVYATRSPPMANSGPLPWIRIRNRAHPEPSAGLYLMASNPHWSFMRDFATPTCEGRECVFLRLPAED